MHYFNIAKLGALAEEYLDDFYGSMDDGVNGGAPTDRLFVSWDLTAELPSLAARNAQGRPSGASIALAIDESGHPASSQRRLRSDCELSSRSLRTSFHFGGKTRPQPRSGASRSEHRLSPTSPLQSGRFLHFSRKVRTSWRR